jgi:GDPmannose 4,6-dehydratase
MKRGLICGVSGQDGAYLAQLLLQEGYEVHGTSRDAQMATFANLEELGIRKDVHTESMSLTDFRSVLQVLSKVKPDEIYNLAGQSSVALSFQQPVETMESICIGTLNLLEAVRFIDAPVKIYNAASGESYGETVEIVDETTPFRPRSPYAVAKAAAFWEVVNYREAYGLRACSGILFNHESPLRPERFVTKKVIAAACRIKKGSTEKLRLGNLAVRRDWGWSPEYVKAMWLMLQQQTFEDYVIATGKTHSLEEFVEKTFSQLGLQWRDHVVSDQSLVRPADIHEVQANPAKAERVLGWKAKYSMPDVVKMIIEHEMNRKA